MFGRFLNFKLVQLSIAARLAAEKMAAVLDEAGKARQKGIQLKHVDFAQELSTQLLQHAETMEEKYAALQDLASKDPVRPDSDFQTLFDSIDPLSKWYENTQAKETCLSNVSITPFFFGISKLRPSVYQVAVHRLQGSANGIIAGLNKKTGKGNKSRKGKKATSEPK